MKLYVVHAGDSLAAIADKNSTTVDVLRGLNNGVDDSHLYEGMKLKIDGGALPIKTGMRSEKLKVKWHHQQPAPAVQSSVSPKQAQQQVQSVVAPTTQKPAAAADAGVVKEKQPVMPVAQPKLNWAYAPQVSAPINPMSAGTQPSTVSPATAGNGSATQGAPVQSPSSPVNLSPALGVTWNQPNGYNAAGTQPSTVSPATAGSGSATQGAPVQSPSSPANPSPALGVTWNQPNGYNAAGTQPSTVSPATAGNGSATQGASVQSPSSPVNPSPALGVTWNQPVLPPYGTVTVPTQSVAVPTTPSAPATVKPYGHSTASGVQDYSTLFFPMVAASASGAVSAPQKPKSDMPFPMQGPGFQPTSPWSDVQISAAPSGGFNNTHSPQPYGLSPAQTGAVMNAYGVPAGSSQSTVQPVLAQAGIKQSGTQGPNYPFANANAVTPDLSYTNPAASSPWSKAPAVSPSGAGQTAPGATKPAHGKAGKGTVGGYPYPYMPALGNSQRPCGCGGPQLYSPFYQPPATGYYAGNRLPYGAIPSEFEPKGN